MKKLFFLVIVINSMFKIYAQAPEFPIDSETGKIIYTGIVEVPNATEENLFFKANEWFAIFFKSSKDVIQFSEKESGKIIGKGITSVYFKTLGMTKDVGYVSFTIDIDIKEGRFRYTIRDFWHHAGSSSNVISPGDLRIEKSGFQLAKKAWIQIKEQTDESIKQMIKDMESSMSSQNNNKDW